MVPLQPWTCFTASFLGEYLEYCGDSIQICCGIVWEDCVEQKQPNLMQALKETTELHPDWSEQAGFLGKGALGRANPQWYWHRETGLSDSINEPKHAPWKKPEDKRKDTTPSKLVGSCHKNCLQAPVLRECLLVSAMRKSYTPPYWGSRMWQPANPTWEKKATGQFWSHKVNPGPSPSFLSQKSHSSMGEGNRLGWWGCHGDKQECMNRKKNSQLLRSSKTSLPV